MGSDPEPVSWPGSELGPSAANLYASTCTRPIFLIFILCICMYMNMYVYAFICLIVWVWINFFPSYYTLSASVLCTCIIHTHGTFGTHVHINVLCAVPQVQPWG